MDEKLKGPLLPGNLVQLLDATELTELATEKGANLPKKWAAFPIEAKRIAVKNLLNGGYTLLGFEILEPDFLEQLKRIADDARESLKEINAILDISNGPVN